MPLSMPDLPPSSPWLPGPFPCRCKSCKSGWLLKSGKCTKVGGWLGGCECGWENAASDAQLATHAFASLSPGPAGRPGPATHPIPSHPTLPARSAPTTSTTAPTASGRAAAPTAPSAPATTAGSAAAAPPSARRALTAASSATGASARSACRLGGPPCWATGLPGVSPTWAPAPR